MSAPATIADTLNLAGERLRAASISNDLLDAQTLLAEALGQDRTYLIINYNQQINDQILERYQKLIERRAAGEPLQYITGHQEFFGLEFKVTPDVLIPRPETELIIEETIRLSEQEDVASPLVVDLGTGSGCIAVTLARELNHARVIATDISLAALRVASENTVRHKVESRLFLVASDLLESFVEEPFADFIVSNPPYVSKDELPGLQREVRDWEPRTALTDFGDGLSFYRRLLKEAHTRLKPRGYLICELGYRQAASVTAMIDPQVWGEHRLLNDLQGIPRTLVLRRTGEAAA